MGQLAASPYVVIGAGMHGLSTAYHLALELAAPRARHRRRRRRRRQGDARRRRHRDRLRRRPQQLLPAGDERADAGVRRGLGVRPGGVPLQRRRLHRARPAGAGARPRRRLRAPGADRLPLGAHRRRGGGRRPHEGPLSRLARQGRHRLPARAPGRVRLQPRVGRGPPGQVPRGRRPDPGAHRGDGLRARRGRRRRRRRDERRPHRGRRAGRRRPRALGAEALVDARPPRPDRRPHPVGRRRARPADVDVLEPPGGGDRASTRCRSPPRTAARRP